MENPIICKPAAFIVFPLHIFRPNYSKQLPEKLYNKSAFSPTKIDMLEVHFSQSFTLPLQICNFKAYQLFLTSFCLIIKNVTSLPVF